VARELVRYKLYAVDVQEVRWDTGGSVRAQNYIIFYRKQNSSIGKRIFCTAQNSISS